LLTCCDSVYRANILASAAVNTGGGVDYILAVSFGDAVNWALRFTCAAVDAVVVNYICHDFILLFVIYSYCSIKNLKNK